MKSEFLKFRSLPTPRYSGLFLLAAVALGTFIVYKNGSFDSSAFQAAISLPSMIVALILGAWIVGVEYGQNTLRQVLSSDPSRSRLVVSKVIVLLVVLTVAVVVLFVLAYLLFSLVSESTMNYRDFQGTLVVTIIDNAIYATIGLAFGFIAKSMAGAVTLSLVFFFVIDGIFTLIPKIGQYSIGKAIAAFNTSI